MNREQFMKWWGKPTLTNAKWKDIVIGIILEIIALYSIGYLVACGMGSAYGGGYDDVCILAKNVGFIGHGLILVFIILRKYYIFLSMMLFGVLALMAISFSMILF